MILMYIYSFFALATIFILYGSFIFYKINKFNKIKETSQYKEIKASFYRYEEKSMSIFINILGTRKELFPVFSFKIKNEENYIKSKYKVKDGTYHSGQPVNCIYQDVDSEQIFESPENGKNEATKSVVAGSIILLISFALYLYKLIYS